MGKPVKIILSVIAASVFLIIIAVFALPFFVDPNNFKPEIAAAVKAKTGRDLDLTGELKLSIFPWLGISTGQMALGNAAGFQEQPFATLEASDIKVKLLPLLTKKIDVSRIVLKGLALHLAKNPQGVNNWDDLTATDATKTTPSASLNNSGKPNAGNALAVFAIGGIVVENARITWDDQRSGKHLFIKDLNLTADKFAYDERVAVDLALVVLNPDTKFTESIKLTTGLTVNEKLDTFALSHSELQTSAEGEHVPGKSLAATIAVADAVLETSQHSVKVSGLQFQSKDVTISAELSGNNLNGQPVFQGPVTVAAFNPVQLMMQLGITVPVMQDAHALNRSAISFNLLATENSVALQNLAMTLDDSQIKGSTQIKDFDQPVITFNLAADAIDVDRYLPPVKDPSSRPTISPAVALAAGVYALSAETLKKLNIDGQLSAGKLKVNGLSMQGMQLTLAANNGVIKTQQSAKAFYQGTYNGSLSADIRNKKPNMVIDEKISHVQVEPLLKDFNGEAQMSGVVNLSAQLHGQGNNAGELKSSLNGSLSFLFKDSAVKGFNLQKMITQAQALIKEPTLPANNKNDQTLFSEITGTATLSDGVIKNNDLVATASLIHINGKGSADLNTEKLDYKINARLVKAAATATTPEQFHDTPINITVAGTFSKPTYTLDVAALLTEKNKAKIEEFIDKNHDKIDKLADKIDKKLGPGVGDLLKGLFKKH